MKQARRISIFIFPIILHVSCSDGKKIDDTQLAQAYVDLLVVEDYYSESDSLDMKRERVFKKYSISEEEYDTAFVKMSYDAERWENFFNLANSYLDSLKIEVRDGKIQALP